MSREFTVGASQPPAATEDVDRLIAFAKSTGQALPADFLELLREATEIEIIVGDRGCIRLWSPDGVIDMNTAHELQKYLPNALAIGDDEGEMAYVLMRGSNGPGLYRLSFSDPDPQEAVFVAPSLQALLMRGVGSERLFAWEE